MSSFPGSWEGEKGMRVGQWVIPCSFPTLSEAKIALLVGGGGQFLCPVSQLHAGNSGTVGSLGPWEVAVSSFPVPKRLVSWTP